MRGLLPYPLMALDAQVPILPVAVNWSRRSLAKGQLATRPGTIEGLVGPPIPTVGLGKDALDDLVERTRTAITGLRRRDPAFEG